MKIIKLSEKVFFVDSNFESKEIFRDVYVNANQILMIRTNEEGTRISLPGRGFSMPVKETPEQILEIIKKTPEI